MTPEEYIERFKEQRPAEFSVVRGVTGRFIRGTRPSDFKMLSDEPGKKLSWSLPVTRQALLSSSLQHIHAPYHQCHQRSSRERLGPCDYGQGLWRRAAWATARALTGGSNGEDWF